MSILPEFALPVLVAALGLLSSTVGFVLTWLKRRHDLTEEKVVTIHVTKGGRTFSVEGNVDVEALRHALDETGVETRVETDP